MSCRYPGADDAAVDRAAAKADHERHAREMGRANLVDGLVGDRLKLYHNNAHFYHSINALADMLPYWVDGIAAEAERRDDGWKRRQPRHSVIPPEFDPPGLR